MKYVGNYKKIFVLLAIAAVFSTVAPVHVFAEDSSLITNVVFSSQSTGGISSKGADGEDGKPGQDGKPGASGKSAFTIDGKSNAVIHIDPVTDITKALDVQNMNVQIESTSSANAAAAQDTTTSSPVEAQVNLESSSNTNFEHSAFSALKETLSSWKVMLVTYVTLLF